MHPYAEYLQKYLIENFGYSKDGTGRPANDFRITKWGKVLRKYWLDELPQLINLFKGDLKVVGVRPVSQVRFNEFPEDMQELRTKDKPGCIPPYVALLMKDEKQNIEAERIYLNEKLKHPS
jgi:lipopolysaccharide/colanic/teichoic acid biosynthesis glycosyltransferase